MRILFKGGSLSVWWEQRIQWGGKKWRTEEKRQLLGQYGVAREMRSSGTKTSIFLTNYLHFAFMYLRLGTTLVTWLSHSTNSYKSFISACWFYVSRRLSNRNGREDKNETLVVFKDVNCIFIAVASLTDGYPVSARILLPLASPKWGADNSLTKSAHLWRILTVKKQLLKKLH